DELAALEPGDVFYFSGGAEVNRFSLSCDKNPVQRAAYDDRILNSAISFARANNCGEIVLALPWTDTDRIDRVCESIKVLPVSARLLPDMRVRSLRHYSLASPNVL